MKAKKRKRLRKSRARTAARIKLPPSGAKIKPVELTDDLTRRIVDALHRGANLSTASNSVGLDPAVFAQWLRSEGEPYETLRSFVRQALAHPELNALTAMMLAVEEDPRQAFEYLRTRYTDKYGPREARAPMLDYGRVLEEIWEERRAAEVEASPSPLKQLSDQRAAEAIERLRDQEAAS